MTIEKKYTAESEALEKLLRQIKPEGIVTYRTISEVIKEDPQKQAGRGIVYRLRKKLLADGIVFYPVAGVGIKRLTDAEMIDASVLEGKYGHRKYKKSLHVLKAANYDELSPEDKIRHNSQATVVAAVQLFQAPKQRRLIEQAVRDRHDELDVTSTLQLFTPKKAPGSL